MPIIRRSLRAAALASASAFALTVALPAAAQTPPSDDADAVDDRMVVTATRRAESIQDVPVSVATVDAETIQARAIIDLADLSKFIPNFEFSDASILPNLYVRGIGSGTTHSIEQSVGRFVDDVYIGRAAINFHPLMDVANVEVLRGPQGTLFGKNTLGGALIINTGNPTATFDAGAEATVSRFSTVGGAAGVEAFVSGPILPSLRGRVAVFYSDREGYIENLAPGPDGGTREDWGARLKLSWDLDDLTTADFKFERMSYDEEGLTPSETVSGPPLELFQSFQPSFTFDRDWQSSYDCTRPIEGTTFCPNRDQDSHNVTAALTRQFPGAGELKLISGYQEVDFFHQFSQVDAGVAGSAVRFTRDEAFSGFTQEVRFTSEIYDRFDYIVGAYYENSEITRLQTDDQNLPAFLGGGPPPRSFNEDWTQDTETIAIFGQTRLRVTDRLSAIVGARWAQEEKDFTLVSRTVAYNEDPVTAPLLLGPDGEPIGEVVDFEGSRTESRVTPSLTLRYEATPDVMFFGTVSQGHKTGGFSDRPQEDQEFDEEVNTAFEVGTKASLLDGRLQVNIAGFRMQIEDLQVARTLPDSPSVAFEVQNAAEAISQGVEVDGVFDIGGGFTVGGNFAYTDATYDDFPGASEACPEVGGFIETDDTGRELCNFAGIPLIFAPEFKGTLYGIYDRPDVIAGWGLNLNADANYSSDYFVEQNYFENLRQDDYVLYNASAALISPDGRYSVRVFGKNLSEEYVLAWGLEAGPSRFVAPNTPREIGVQLSFRY